MTIEDDVEGIIKEENPQAEAVKSLLHVKERKKGERGSDIELKTDLDVNACNVHTAVDLINSFINMDEQEFTKQSIIGDLVNTKERKLLSKDRQSRKEIVEVARNPDMMLSQDRAQESFVKRLFTSRKKPIQ